MSQIYVFFCIPASNAEAAAVIPNGAKKETAIFINGPADLLNKDPKNPPDLIILLICALESFMSTDVLLLKACLSFDFVLPSIIIHVVNYYHQKFS